MIDKEIIDFIHQYKVATIACVEENKPYCFNCYYSFMEQDGFLVYKSSFNTRHENILNNNKQVAGTIIPEQIEVSTIRGIQFEGIFFFSKRSIRLLNETKVSNDIFPYSGFSICPV